MEEYAEQAIEIECYYEPERPSVQIIDLRMRRNDVVIGSLEAIRFALSGYHPRGDAELIAEVFDDHSAYSSGLGEELMKRRRVVSGLLGDVDSCGLIGILKVRVDPDARGTGISADLIDHLRNLHAGMTWHVALQAVPLDLREGDRSEFLAMRSRLVAYYARMGFERPSPRGSPELMVMIWNGENDVQDDD